MNKMIAVLTSVATIFGTPVSSHSQEVQSEIRADIEMTARADEEGAEENISSLMREIKNIVPGEYSIDRGNVARVKNKPFATSKQGKDWVEQLMGLASREPNLFVRINEQEKLISLVHARSNNQSRTIDVQENTWRINAGEKISTALSRWVGDAGWEAVFWDAPEFISDTKLELDGELADAILKVVTSLRSQGHQVRVILYGGNKVVRVTEGAK